MRLQAFRWLRFTNQQVRGNSDRDEEDFKTTPCKVGPRKVGPPNVVTGRRSWASRKPSRPKLWPVRHKRNLVPDAPEPLLRRANGQRRGVLRAAVRGRARGPDAWRRGEIWDSAGEPQRADVFTKEARERSAHLSKLIREANRLLS